MNLRQLGRTGEFVSEVGIGTWAYHGGVGPLRSGFAAGSRFIDTAESYGVEDVVGTAIRGMATDVFVATKVSPQNFRAADLKRSIDQSLVRLGLERIDLLQLHEPNDEIPIEEPMSTLACLVETGKIRFVGVSNFSVRQFEAAQAAFHPRRIVSNQVRYSIIDRTIETELLPHHQQNGVTVIAYSPLGRDMTRIKDCDPTGVVDEVACMTGRTRAQVVLNWCLRHENVIVIPKGNSEGHVQENCGASDWRLSSDQVKMLDTRIRYRRRGRLDALLRRHTPGFARAAALRAANLLPSGVRRRVL